MNALKIFILSMMSVWAVFTASAQEREPIHNVWNWDFKGFKQWYASNDTVYGKRCDELDWHFILSGLRPLEINEKTYMLIGQTPTNFSPTGSSVECKGRGDDNVIFKRDSYSIAVRREGGRVYANREDYLYYQQYHRSNIVLNTNMLSFGNPDYLPYHLTADSTELILYDYNMEVGDSYRHVDGHADISVVKKDMVVYNDGLSRRRLTLNNGLILVEGIGCINSNGMLIDYLNPEAQYQENYTFLLMCQDDIQKETIYDYKSAGLHIAEWDASGISQTLDVQKTATKGMSDLQGRRLTGQPRRGLYIRGGRKYATR